ncbi:MAG TPA: hypothetical protein PKH07_17515, partial [bacterium]|nr:hypothetical protein [bacterium]
MRRFLTYLCVGCLLVTAIWVCEGNGELLEWIVAMVDGYPWWRIFWRILLPVARPAIVAGTV